MKWRRKVEKRARTDAKFRTKLKALIKKDFLFFLAGFCYLQEPRAYDQQGNKRPSKIPFLPWPHQVPIILDLREHIGKRDVVVEKSRDEGMSWTALYLVVHDWLFIPNTKIGLVSSTENLSDDASNMDSLGAKVDWILASLPEWLVGPRVPRTRGCTHGYVRDISKHAWINCRNRTTINAFSGGPDVGRGGRYLWFFIDELASKQWQTAERDYNSMYSTSKATSSRLLLSTPGGPEGAYYDAVHEPSDDAILVKLRILWWENPTKNRGLYRMEKGIPIAVDPVNNPLPADYNPPSPQTLERFAKLRARGFNLDKGFRSPWKDLECLRPAETPQSEARELDLDYGGALDRFFGDDFRAKLLSTERLPYVTGHFNVNDTLTKWVFDKQDGAPFHVWCSLDANNNPPPHKYLVACDSATGDGGAFSSNSVLEVVDVRTGEQVAEFASKNIGRGAFADFAIGVCKWFNNAYLIWEHQGPGTAFTKRVMDQGYSYFYRRKLEWTGSGRKVTKDAGWVTTEDTKQMLMDELKLAIMVGGSLVVRSKSFRLECEQYVNKANSTQHVAAKDKTHADRVIALGLAVQGMKDLPAAPKDKAASLKPWGDGPPPYGTAAHRQWEWEQEQRDKGDDWDDRSTADLAGRNRISHLIGAR